jgi:hypothetical protein
MIDYTRNKLMSTACFNVTLEFVELFRCTYRLEYANICAISQERFYRFMRCACCCRKTAIFRAKSGSSCCFELSLQEDLKAELALKIAVFAANQRTRKATPSCARLTSW